MRYLFALGCLLLLPLHFAAAETALRVAESVTINTDQRVESDFYAAATTIAQTGTIVGDMYAVGGAVTVKGPIESDLTVVAGRVTVDSPVADDVRLLAGEASVSDTVGGDVFVLGGSLRVLPTANITGNVYVFGGEAEIAGNVGGSIYGRAERIRVDAVVAGGIDVTARQGLALGARAEVAGDVRHQSMRTLVRAPEAVVNGSVVENSLPLIEDDAGIADRVLPFLVMLFGSIVLYLIGREFMSATVSRALSHPVRAGFIGLAVYVVGPVLGVFLLATVLGLIVGLGALGVFVVTLALSYSVAPMLIGVWLWRLFGGASVLQPFAILLGVAVLQVCLLIPVFGLLVLFVASVMAAGALVEVAARRLMHSN